MKRFCIVVLLGVISYNLHASIDTLLIVQVPPIEVGDSGQMCVWDYSNVKDSLFHDVYILRDSVNPGRWDVCKTGSKYQYQEHHDTLYITGFENATTLMKYSQPIACHKTPLEYGDSIAGSFWGEGEYCHLLPITTEGTYVSKVDGYGRLIFQDRQVDDVFRVVTSSEITKHIYDTTHFRMREYRWYKRNIMYPLLEATEVITELPDDTIFSRFAFYTVITEEDDIQDKHDSLPEEQELLTEEILCFTEGRFLPNPVVNDLLVTYHLTRTATIWFSLHSSRGLVMYQSSPTVQEEGDWQLNVPMTGFPQDDYVLYIHVDDIVLAETIIKM